MNIVTLVYEKSMPSFYQRHKADKEMFIPVRKSSFYREVA